MKTLLTGAAVLSLALTAPLSAADHHNEGQQRTDIVDAASAAPQFSTLVDAVVAAGLVDALEANGPLTVFAPNNDAFAKLDAVPSGDALTSVLTYHVVAGRYPSSRLVAMAGKSADGVDLETLNGQTINARVSDGMLVLSDAAGNDIGVVTADINTANGVIHEVDSVLLPAM